MPRRWRLVLLAGLIALIAALVQWRVVDREPGREEAAPARPGYYLTGVDLEEFGADGKLRIGLQSISANEDPQTGVVRLSDVAVDYHAPAGQVWHLTSEEAQVPPGGRERLATSARGEYPRDRKYTAAQLLATVYQTLGIDPAMTFPDNTGRPVHVLDDREPVRELL